MPGDRLVTSCFVRTTTRGFADSKIDNCAVCLKPGTELVFDKDIRYDGIFWRRNSKQRVARFRQVNVNSYHTHHDAIELPDGKVILVTNLRSGQVAHVVQLPHKPWQSMDTSHLPSVEPDENERSWPDYSHVSDPAE